MTKPKKMSSKVKRIVKRAKKLAKTHTVEELYELLGRELLKEKRKKK